MSQTAPHSLWLPRPMAIAPMLDPNAIPGPLRRRYALLINPFYRKDPHASFGKHVLTPTLALTAVAGATPAHWQVSYWDENLLQGPPPLEPFPEVVAITVHLTFAKRAYELARWYRQWGAKVVLGGLHVLSAPEEAAAHADAIALGEGVQLWPQILEDIEAGTLQPVYRGDYRKPYRDDPMPRRDLLPRDSFPHDVERHRDARLSQPLRVLLSLDRRAAHAVPASRRRASRRGDRRRRSAVCRVHRQQSGLQARLLARALPRARAAGDHLERRAHDRRDRRSRRWCARWRSRAARACSSASNR